MILGQKHFAYSWMKHDDNHSEYKYVAPIVTYHDHVPVVETVVAYFVEMKFVEFVYSIAFEFDYLDYMDLNVVMIENELMDMTAVVVVVLFFVYLIDIFPFPFQLKIFHDMV